MTIALALVLVSACANDIGPRLDSALPASGQRDALVTLTGRRLCGSTADCQHAAGQIQLGIAPPVVEATIVSYADTGAQIAIPSVAPIGTTSIVVTVDDRASNALVFEVLP